LAARIDVLTHGTQVAAVRGKDGETRIRPADVTGQNVHGVGLPGKPSSTWTGCDRLRSFLLPCASGARRARTRCPARGASDGRFTTRSPSFKPATTSITVP